MAQQTGDLVPRASGAASIGVEQVTLTGFDAQAIKPYLHIHGISGVLHDPLHGTSGVIRFNGTTGLFELSGDGGLGFALRLGEDDSAAGRGNITGNNGLNIEALAGTINADAAGFTLTASSADITADAVGAVRFTSDNSVRITLSNATQFVQFRGSAGDATVIAGNFDQPGGQIFLQPFDASGELTYQFGPFEAFHVLDRNSGNRFPLPHSGQINQMILETAGPTPGLQVVYGVDPTIVISDGDLVLTSDSDKLVLSTFESAPTVNISGIITEGTFEEVLDFNAFRHNLGGRGPQGQTTQAGLDARAISFPSLTMDTGSGVTNVLMSSGIQRWKSDIAQVGIALFPAVTNIDLSSQRFHDDVHYRYDSSVTGIRILTPGVYHVFGLIGLTSTATTTVFASLSVNGTNQTAIGNSAAIIANQFAGVNVHALLNLQAGDTVELTASTLANTVTSLDDNSGLQLIYLGPPRGATS
jgi:hypothetical protein